MNSTKRAPAAESLPSDVTTNTQWSGHDQYGGTTMAAKSPLEMAVPTIMDRIG
ncbi:MAG: hypothetical protein Q7U76_06095 [Nitrospirota bacterium]|nr:hypothetical protein [Nitrospirota bacterium]